MKLNLQQYGSGEPLVILHGLFGSLTNWNSISKMLASQYRVIAVDLRNHGSSPHSTSMSYPEMAEDLRELFEDQGLVSAFVLGHSMGGKAAMQFAITYPDLVERLIVVDIAPRAYQPHHDELFAAMSALDLAAYTTRNELDAALAQSIPDRGVRQFLLTNVVRDGEHFHWKINLDGIRTCYDEVIAGLSTSSRFPNPTLFIRGATSDYILAQDEPTIKAMFPESTIATVANAGHWVHAEAPAEFVRLVRDFLASSNA
jgi:pimeloyl-ACP methyl ester carboxylesterase